MRSRPRSRVRVTYWVPQCPSAPTRCTLNEHCYQSPRQNNFLLRFLNLPAGWVQPATMGSM